MKLKKIASLMLAGIMAVSMLAGCKSGTPDSKPNEGEEENTASGYSAMLGEKAADDLAKNDLDEIFTFADNADDQKALEKMVVNVSDSHMRNWVVNNTVGILNTSKYSAYTNVFEDKADLDRDSMLYYGVFMNDHNELTYKVGDVWVANGDVDLDNVMDKIYNEYKAALKAAPKTGKVNSFNVEYDYTFSVSVVNKEVKSSSIFNGSVNFVAVTLTRTAEFV